MLELPDLDFTLSPHTGLTRIHWAAFADRLLLALRPYFSPDRAFVRVPGRVSSHGVDSDGLEGFARSFLLVGFRVAGEGGADPHGFLDWYRAGLIAGTDPGSAERWPRLTELDQAKVEAASIALVLELTRAWLWDTLTVVEQQNVIRWFEDAVGTWYPDNNWVWFRAVVETFLADVGGRFDESEIAKTLAFHASCAREHGWYSDSPTERAFDYYSGWAMQFYPLFWAAQPGAARFGARELEDAWRTELSEYLDDYLHLIGGDGMPVLQGRSLIYRFAAAAPLWVGAVAEVDGPTPGQLRRGASGLLRAFLERGVPDERGLLTLGITRAWPAMAQSYSGAASPYWAAKGMYGLVLPPDHPVWTAVEEPLPVERGDARRLIVAPGWLVSGTSADGVVRLVNHGTDHEVAGARTADSPLYARLGYSTTTVPPLGADAVSHPVDQLAAVVDAGGAVAHRAGFLTTSLGDDGVALVGSSRAAAHWVDLQAGGRDHGSGYTGRLTEGPDLVVASALRGPWEVRAVSLVGDARTATAVRISGWPVAASDGPPGVRAQLLPLRGTGAAVVETATVVDRSPLADRVEVQQLTVPIGGARQPVVVAIELGASPVPPPEVEVDGDGDEQCVRIRWGDGAESELTLVP